MVINLPYARHHNPLLNTNHTYVRPEFLEKSSLKNVFGHQKVGKKYTNRGYNGARTVIKPFIF